MRDEFNVEVKHALAMRVGLRCSNPQCNRPTSGPRTDVDKAVNLGVAAHLSAAPPGGPRYDPDMPSEVRASAQNGIWLCQNCAKLIDNDSPRFPVTELARWKSLAEKAARDALEGSASPLALAKAQSSQFSQSSQILSYSRTFGLQSMDHAQIMEVGRHIHRLVAYAFIDTCAATSFERFVYLSSLVLHAPGGDGTSAEPALGVYIACHITPFVAAFQDLVETLFDRSDEEYIQRTARYPEDLKIKLTYAWLPFSPYEISRTGPKAIRIRLLDKSVIAVQFPMTTSDLLVLLSVMHAGGGVIHDDIRFSPAEVAFMKYTEQAKERGSFKLSDFRVDKQNPETWSVHDSGIRGGRQ